MRYYPRTFALADNGHLPTVTERLQLACSGPHPAREAALQSFASVLGMCAADQEQMRS